MRMRLAPLCVMSLLAVSAVSPADTILRQKTLADLSRAKDSTVFDLRNTEVVSVGSDASGAAATLRFAGRYASFGQSLGTSQDWSPYNMVRMMVQNHESRTVTFKLIVQLGSDPNNYAGAYTGEFTLRPKQTQRFVFHLNVDDPEPFGMEYMRPVLSVVYADVIAGTAFRNLSNIHHWRISNQDTATTALTVKELRLMRQNVTFKSVVDAFGQYTDRGWSGKIARDEDFAARKASELSDLDANPGTGETNGTQSLVNENAIPGRWRVVEQANGRKYLQHPNGRLFWSLGLGNVGEGPATFVEGREDFFSYVPGTTSRYASAFYSITTSNGPRLAFSFNKKNLITKYGNNYEPAWSAMLKKRLASWGINTIGIQSESTLLDGSMPYVIKLATDKFSTRLRPPFMRWGTLPDPYTSGFQSWMTARFTEELAPHLASTALMGVFVDNELSWGDTRSETDSFNVPRGTLNAPSNQPAKVAWRGQLEAKYNTIGALNTAWGSKYSSWDSFLSTRWLPTTFSSGMKSDFRTFAKAYAVKYYGQVDAALITAGLKTLYLGSRLCDWTPEVIDAADNYVDVLSFNYYRKVEDLDWDYLNSLSRPVLFSEFGYGTKSRSTFGGPAPVYEHGERAYEMRRFLEKAASLDNVVGAHWYCYTDQPVTGRWTDMENAGTGIVDVADNPYPESVAALRKFSASLYERRG